MFVLKSKFWIALFLLWILGVPSQMYAQDINANVKILSPQIVYSNKAIFNSLSDVIRDFINSRQWTNHKYEMLERIECNFVFNITKWDGATSFTADVQILASRPVFGTSYKTTIFSYKDKDFQFNYTEGQPLFYSEQNYVSNLISFVSFYSYLIIGLDKDTFEYNGGTAEFAKAAEILQNAQTGDNPSEWNTAASIPSRFWMIENITNKIFAPYRNFTYQMHRKGLDMMIENPEKVRKNIKTALSEIQKVDKQRPNCMINDIYMKIKTDELVQIFDNEDNEERYYMGKLLLDVDPARAEKFKPLLTFK